MSAPAEPQTPPVIDPAIVAQIIAQYEQQAHPFGRDEDYGDEDAKELGLPSIKMLNFLRKFVRKMLGTPFVPKWVAETDNPEGTMLALILRGRELGFQAMESLEVFWKSPDGRLAMWAKTMMALMRKAGYKLDWIKDDPDGCEVTGVRPDGDKYTAKFGHDDAVTAGLWDKKGVGGGASMHQKYPANMNRARCITMLWNTLAADLGGGPQYSREEIEEEVRAKRMEGGGGGNEVFAEHARKTAPNPYGVGSTEAAEAPKADPPKQETKQPETNQTTAPATEAPQAASAPAPAPAAPAAEAAAAEPETVKLPADAPVATEAPAVSGSGQDLKVAYERLVDLCPRISPPTAQNKFGVFLKAFVNKKKLQKGDISAIHLRFLDDLVRKHNDNFLEDPEGMGVACGVGWREFQKAMEEWIWSDRCRQLATDVIFLADHAKSGGNDTIEWLGKESLDVESLAEPDIYAFLQVANRTMLAGGLLDIAKASGKRVYQVVEGWGIDVEKAPVAGIEALLKGSPSEPAAPMSATTAPDAGAAPEAEGEDGENIDDVLSLFDAPSDK